MRRSYLKTCVCKPVPEWRATVSDGCERGAVVQVCGPPLFKGPLHLGRDPPHHHLPVCVGMLIGTWHLINKTQILPPGLVASQAKYSPAFAIRCVVFFPPRLSPTPKPRFIFFFFVLCNLPTINIYPTPISRAAPPGACAMISSRL